MSVKDKADAIDRFVRTIKASGVYDDIQAACIMAGWTNLAGALYPLKGAAPTNGGGLFQDADLDPGIGLKGDGSSKYLDSNRAENADPQNDAHISAFSSSPAGSGPRVSIGSQFSWIASDDVSMYFRRNSNASASIAVTNATGFLGAARADASGIGYRVNGAAYNYAAVSRIPSSAAINVFRHPTSAQYNDATLSWYSIGSATDLAALDSAVSTLMADLRAIDEAGFDRDALAYIRNVEAADGSYLETGVKQAINAFVVGCKKDGIWDAIKASCILCGARTISGALVPLVVDYGPELWSDTAVPTLVLDGGQGGTPAYDATTRTMSFTGTGASVAYPRFIWGGLGIALRRQYRVVGRLSGDIGNVYSITLGSANAVQYDSATGVFSSTLPASSVADFRIYLNGTLGSASVTIEELSIREDRSTPTAHNFTSTSYNRSTGLVGVPASGTYIDSNRAGNADGQNDAHLAVYKTDAALASGYIAARYTTAGTLAGIFRSGSNPRFWVNDAVGYTPLTGDAAIAGFFAASRNSPSQIEWKSPTSGGTAVASSLGVSAWTTNIFATTSGTDGSPAGHSAARLAFYSIGSAIPDLALLDNRVSTLVAAIAAAI